MLGKEEVNYPARDMGVTRHMRGDEAKQKCPEIVLARVPQVRGKADLTKYREAGKRVAEVLQTFTTLLERASIDEAYLDITELVEKKKDLEPGRLLTIDKIPNTFVVGYDKRNFLESLELSESNHRLAVGGVIVEEIREKVYKETGYKCSAGIAHNKILAKLVCGLHKPNKQTILPQESVPEMYKNLSVKKIKSLGGKFGDVLSEELQISNMGELIQFSEKELIKRFDEKNGKWLFNIARGIDLEPVTTKLISKSIGCCKTFPGKNCLTNHENVVHWLNELASEISERLEKDMEENNRRAKQMVISFSQKTKDKEVSSSRTHHLNSYDQSRIAQDSVEVVKKFCQKNDGSYNITFLGISVGNFQDIKSTMNIASFFKSVNSSGASKERAFPQKSTNKVNTTSSFCQELPVRDTNKKENENSIQLGKVEVQISSDKNNSKPEIENAQNEKSINKEYDLENISVYSASTDDLDEDPKNYIYYEDIYPESVSRKPVSETLKGAENLSNESTLKGHDSLDNNQEKENQRKMSMGSFFKDYFDSSNENSISSPIKNNSKIEENTSIEEHHENAAFYKGNSLAIHQSLQEFNNPEKQVCPECNKKIVISEMQSHMDYHFALEIVKKEAHLYTPQNQGQSEKVAKNSKETKKCKSKNMPETQSISKFVQKGDMPNNKDCNNKMKTPSESQKSENLGDSKGQCDSPENTNKGVKRKAINAKPISSFFAKFEKVDEENSEYCSECDKRIPLNDLASHNDYHVAKRIHAEINLPVSRVSGGNSSKKCKIKKTGGTSISDFFKNV